MTQGLSDSACRPHRFCEPRYRAPRTPRFRSPNPTQTGRPPNSGLRGPDDPAVSLLERQKPACHRGRPPGPSLDDPALGALALNDMAEQDGVAGAEQDAKARVSRRQALIGAGAALSAPTITSLASAPAYANCNSADFVLDNFTTDQGSTHVYHDGSFPFGLRRGGVGDPGHFTVIENGVLTMSNPTLSDPFGLQYGPYPSDGGDIYTTIPAECTQLVIQDVSKYEGKECWVGIQDGYQGPVYQAFGVLVDTEMVLDLGAVPKITDPRLDFKIPWNQADGAPDPFQFVAEGPIILR